MKILALSFLLVFALPGCPNPFDSGGSEVARITARSGLRLRKTPHLNGKRIGLVPFGSRVEILETEPEVRTIDGKRGRWTRIRWRKMKGWVFGGYLARQDPGDAEPSETRGFHLLSEITSEWRELEGNTGGYYFFAPCFAGIRSVTLNQRDPEPPQLVVFLGQYADPLTIQSVEAHRDGGTMLYRFTVSNSTASSSNNFQVEFRENRDDARIGFWSNLQNSGRTRTFADVRHADSFPLKKEKEGDCGEP